MVRPLAVLAVSVGSQQYICHGRDFLVEEGNHRHMLNPLYEKNASVLLITVTALNVTLWKRLFLRTDLLEELELPGYEALRLLKEENRSRQERLKDVRRC